MKLVKIEITPKVGNGRGKEAFMAYHEKGKRYNFNTLLRKIVISEKAGFICFFKYGEEVVAKFEGSNKKGAARLKGGEKTMYLQGIEEAVEELEQKEGFNKRIYFEKIEIEGEAYYKLLVK